MIGIVLKICFVNYVYKKEDFFMNLNYTRIIHFLTIVKYMNMNRAAEELCISQPALSLSVSRLEDELGITLFYRTKKKLILSEEAQLLLPYFKQMQLDHNSLVHEAQLLRNPATEQFINISFSGSQYFFISLQLSGILEQFGKKIPKLCYLDCEQALEMLLSRQLDFAISCPHIQHPRVTTVELFTEPIGLALPRSHPIAERSVISPKELEDIPIHGLSKENPFRRLCDELFSQLDVSIHYATESNMKDYNKLMGSGEQTNGFLSTPANYHFNLREFGDYAFLSIDHASLNRKMGISFLSDSSLPYRYSEFITGLKESASILNQFRHKLGRYIMDALMDTLNGI